MAREIELTSKEVAELIQIVSTLNETQMSLFDDHGKALVYRCKDAVDSEGQGLCTVRYSLNLKDSEVRAFAREKRRGW